MHITVTLRPVLDGYLTSEDAATHLGVGQRTLYNLARGSAGFPAPIRVGRTLLWKTTELDAWRAKHPARRKRTRSDL